MRSKPTLAATAALATLALLTVTFPAAYHPDQNTRTVAGELVIAEAHNPDGTHTTTAAVRTTRGFVEVDPAATENLESGDRVQAQVTSGAKPATKKVTKVAAPAKAKKVSKTKKGALRHKVSIVIVTPKGVKGKPVSTSQATNAVKRAAKYWAKQGTGVKLSVARTVKHYKSRHSCNSYWDLWDEAAKKAKFKFEPGHHLVLFLPAQAYTRSTCSYGLGTVGSHVSAGGMSYVTGLSTSTVIHELGHNMSLRHAQVFDDRYGEAANGKRVVEYGAPYSAMGFGFADRDSRHPGNISARQLHRIGLMPKRQVRTVKKNTTTTVRAVDAVAGRSTKLKKTIKATDPNTQITYWLEYRPRGGFDHRAPWWTQPGLLIRTDNPKLKTQSILIDTRKRSRSSQDASLTKGRTWTSRGKGLRVRLVSAGTRSATVRVTFHRDKALPKVTLKAPKKGRYHSLINLRAKVSGNPKGRVRFHAIHAGGTKSNLGTVKVKKGKAHLEWIPKASLAKRGQVQHIQAVFLPKSSKLKKSRSDTKAFKLRIRKTKVRLSHNSKNLTVRVTGGHRKPKGTVLIEATSQFNTKRMRYTLKGGRAVVPLSRIGDGVWDVRVDYETDSMIEYQRTWDRSSASMRNLKIGNKQEVTLTMSQAPSHREGRIAVTFEVIAPPGGATPTGQVWTEKRTDHGNGDYTSVYWTAHLTDGKGTVHVPKDTDVPYISTYRGDANYLPTKTTWRP